MSFDKCHVTHTSIKTYNISITPESSLLALPSEATLLTEVTTVSDAYCHRFVMPFLELHTNE